MGQKVHFRGIKSSEHDLKSLGELVCSTDARNDLLRLLIGSCFMISLTIVLVLPSLRLDWFLVELFILVLDGLEARDE
jgi:hypothetical protein